jgi:hypothetical protein
MTEAVALERTTWLSRLLVDERSLGGSPRGVP